MRVILATVLAAAIVTPAAAEYYISGYDWLGRPIATQTQNMTVKKTRRGAGAYAQSPIARQSLHSQNDVYVNGVYAGSDPDWRIRATIRSDFIDD